VLPKNKITPFAFQMLGLRVLFHSNTKVELLMLAPHMTILGWSTNKARPGAA